MSLRGELLRGSKDKLLFTLILFSVDTFRSDSPDTLDVSTDRPSSAAVAVLDF